MKGMVQGRGDCSHFFIQSVTQSFVQQIVIAGLLYMYGLLMFKIFGCDGSCCCTWAFSSCGEQGLLFFAVRGLLIAVASLVAEHGL